METITPAELQSRRKTQPGLAVLDVRTPVEFDEVHVEAARNIPLDTLDPKALYEKGTLRAGEPVYLLCRSGTRARQAAEKFAAQGHDTGVVVTGGTLGWIEAGLPVQRSATPVMSLERQIRIVAGAMVLAGVLLGYLVHPYFIWLSAFVGAANIYAGLTDWCGMGLLLAKAPWNQRKAG